MKAGGLVAAAGRITLGFRVLHGALKEYLEQFGRIQVIGRIQYCAGGHGLKNPIFLEE